MAQYPIKMLKDENGTPFVPLVAPEAVKDNQGTDWQALIDKKLEKTNIIAGDNITLSVSGNDITINGASDYTALSNKPSLDTTSDVSLNPLKEEINGEISLNKIAKTGNYKDLLYKPIIPITFTDNMESDYSISKLPGWQVDLLQKMIDEYVKDNKSINNYILKADGIMFLEDYAIGNLDNKYSTEGKNTRLYTFKKCGPYGSIPHAFQFVGPTSLSYTKYPESGYGVINISNKGILIYCDNNYRVTEVCQRYKLYDEAEKNTSVSIEVVPTNLSRATAFIATKDHQPATKKYVDDSVGGIHIPTKTSQLQNDSDFVIKTTNELTNYYTKNNTYTKNEVDALVAGGSGASDYSDLTNKPKINNVELSGNKSLSDLGIINLNNVLDGNAIGSARTIGAKDSEGQPLGVYAWAEGQYTIASGDSSHAEGGNTRASGYISHAEGMSTKALGDYSHAEGSQTEASGQNSHAEGIRTTASGSNSHAEGDSTIASGDSSHAEGLETKAQGNNQHVQGKYNIADTTSAHIVGNGTKYNARSNAHTLDWSGNAWFAGDVYTGSTSGTNKDEGSKILATKEYVDSKTSALQGHVIENMLDVVIYRLSNLDNKSEFRFFGPSNSGVIALGLSFENVSLTSGDKFEMSATFQTSSSECTFEITESTSVKVKLTGDDVTNGVLNPVVNKVYEIAFHWNGFFMSGVVRGFEHRSSK